MSSKLLILEFFFFSSTNSSSEELVNQALLKMCKLQIHSGVEPQLLTDERIIPVIIEHIKVLCEILRLPSFNIVTCEKLLISFWKTFYCDHQRSRVNHHWQNKYVYAILKYIRVQVCDALQVERKRIIENIRFNDEVTLYLLDVYRYSKFITCRF